MNKKRIIRECICTTENGSIEYDIYFSSRRTISIQIIKNEKIIIKLPLHCSVEDADAIIIKKYDWIVNTIAKIKEKQKTISKRIYEDGASHLLLGKSYALIIDNNNDNSVYINNDNIIVSASGKDKIEKAMKVWYLRKAQQIIAPIFAKMANSFAMRHKKEPSMLDIKHVKSYWGQCTYNGVIRINADLVRAPEECIEYIIAHELCHLIYADHSKRFYKLLDEEMPPWKERQKLLNSIISSRH